MFIKDKLYLCDEYHMLAAEFLLQLTHEPHLDLLEGLQLGHRHKDDDGFPATTNLDFLRE